MPSRVRTTTSQVTLARAVSKLGIASRSQAVELIIDGKVKVGGKVVRSPSVWVDLRNERVTVTGKPLHKNEKIYLALHKPPGYVTTRSDERGRKTVYDCIPKNLPWIFPVGRLDKETSGLLLLTNDTQFGERITAPHHQIAKTYEVVLASSLKQSDQQELERGLTLTDGTELQPASIQIGTGDRVYIITIHEGKNRQIRRMFDHLGYDVVSLKRLTIGKIELGSLKEGEFRFLSQAEIDSVR